MARITNNGSRARFLPTRAGFTPPMLDAGASLEVPDAYAEDLRMAPELAGAIKREELVIAARATETTEAPVMDAAASAEPRSSRRRRT